MSILPSVILAVAVVVVVYNSEMEVGSLELNQWTRWTHELTMEVKGQGDEGFQVKWDAEDPYFLTMEISAPTTGYLGIGFSPFGDMRDSDIVLAWVDQLGIPHLKDYHGIGATEPVEDIQQDYFLISASERDNRTTVRFNRRWDTCDVQHDFKITNDTIRLIWAWGEFDPNPSDLAFSWHGVDSRGSQSIYMRLPNRPLPFPDHEPDPHHRSFQSTQDTRVNIWDISFNDVEINGVKDFLFMCQIFSLPRTNKKYQAIGFRPLITEGNKGFLEEMALFECESPADARNVEAFTEMNETSSELCFDDGESNRENHTHFSCSETLLFSWTRGSPGEMFPTHVGIPIVKRSEKPSYFKLRVHYANLAEKEVMDSSGLRVFLTEDLRLFEGASLLIGHKTSPFLAIPPAQEGFKIYGFCTEDCTRNGIPEQGLNIFGVLFQTHEAGRKVQLRHIRDGKELSLISQDNNYSHNYQQYRLLKDEVRVFPNDQLILECEFNTMDREKFTFGGLSSSSMEEMCQAQLLYYPRVNLTGCLTKPDHHSFFNGFGIQATIGEGLTPVRTHPIMDDGDLIPSLLKLETRGGGGDPGDSVSDDQNNNADPFDSVQASLPSSLFNISVGERMRSLDWSQKHISKNLENSWKSGNYLAFCEGSPNAPIHYRKYIDHLPKFKKLYQPPSTSCRHPTKRNSKGSSTNALNEYLFWILMGTLLNNF